MGTDQCFMSGYRGGKAWNSGRWFPFPHGSLPNGWIWWSWALFQHKNCKNLHFQKHSELQWQNGVEVEIKKGSLTKNYTRKTLSHSISPRSSYMEEIFGVWFLKQSLFQTQKQLREIVSWERTFPKAWAGHGWVRCTIRFQTSTG